MLIAHTRHFLSNFRSPAWKSVAIFWIGFAVLVVLTKPVSAAVPGPWKGSFLGVIVTAGTLLLSWMILRKTEWTLRDIGLALRPSSVARFMLGMGCGLVLIALHYAILRILGGQVSLERVPEVGSAALLAACCSFVPLAAMEELGFRGYPLRRLDASYGLWIAQATVALAFAIYHVVGGVPWITALLGTGMGSILFGMAAIATRGLAVPIGLHAAWNLGAWALGDKQYPGLWRILVAESSRSTSQVAGAIGYFSTMGLATLGFWLIHRRRSRQAT
ncbi:MAG: type II CAAX endopeptidase family protein [Acidobacteriota bacterium]